jgi:hypothetical protein
MRATLMQEIRRNQGALDRRAATAVVSVHVLDDAVRSGVVVPLYRGVYVLAGHEMDRSIRWRAALRAVPGSALSHTTAVEAWRLLPHGPAVPVHLTIAGDTRRPGRQPGLVVHRRRGFALDSTLTFTTGLVVTRPEESAVDAWPMLMDEPRRALVINGVREGRLHVDRLCDALDAQRKPGAAEMRRLLGLLAGGCQSELEIWGLTQVFDHPSLPPARAQRPVRLRDRTVYLDRAYDDVMVAVELDGAAFHFHPQQRERDMGRDAELASLGWVVLRFSYRRLHDDPAGCAPRLLG